MFEQEIVIIIENDKDWLNIMRKLIKQNFECGVEPYISFEKAENRLARKPTYHLVITDIYPEDLSDAKGLHIAQFASFVKDVPVIVISGVKKSLFRNMKKAFKECAVVDFFEKSRFEKLEFIQSVKTALEKSPWSSEDKVNNKITYNVGKGGILIIQDGKGQKIGNISLSINIPPQKNINVEEFPQLLPEKAANLVANYDNEIKEQLQQIINRMDELVEDRQSVFSELMTQMVKIAETNDIINEFVMQLAESKSPENENILNKKMELTLSLIPGILKLKSDFDLDKFLEKTYKAYDYVTFKVYEKLATIYHSLRSKLKV